MHNSPDGASAGEYVHTSILLWLEKTQLQVSTNYLTWKSRAIPGYHYANLNACRLAVLPAPCTVSSYNSTTWSQKEMKKNG